VHVGLSGQSVDWLGKRNRSQTATQARQVVSQQSYGMYAESNIQSLTPGKRKTQGESTDWLWSES